MKRFGKNKICAFKVFHRLPILQLRFPRLAILACQLWWVAFSAIIFANFHSVYLLSTSEQRRLEKAEHYTWHAHYRILKFFHSLTFHYLLSSNLFWSFVFILFRASFTKSNDITFRDALHNFFLPFCYIILPF